MKRFLTVILCLVMTVSTSAWAEDAGRLAFEELSYSVVVGKSITIKAIAQNINGTLKYEWLSSDESIATVKSGKAKGVSGGTAVITCRVTDSDGNVYEATCELFVNIPIKSIKVDNNKVVVGERPFRAPAEAVEGAYYTFKPSVTILPENATIKELEWSSSDPFIANVSKDGLIVGHGYGKATITGKAKDGSGKKVQIKVEVPMCYTTVDKITISDEKGAEFGYCYASVNGISMYGTRETGNCFSTSHIESSDAKYEGLDMIRIMPLKAGKGTISFYRNNRKLKTVTIVIEKSAIRDINNYPRLDIQKAVSNQSKYVGIRASIVGIIDKADNSGSVPMYYAYMTVKDERVYYAFETDKAYESLIGKELTVYGLLDHFSSYETETGLKYEIPVLTNATF